jgi:hypothetical protein
MDVLFVLCKKVIGTFFNQIYMHVYRGQFLTVFRAYVKNRSLAAVVQARVSA